ncbi:MAG TPA: hypothetical protein VK901_10040 [Nitrospiraceae bacterium]|nr:hypothetical protein [Nitrospiraceae bacterium]
MPSIYQHKVMECYWEQLDQHDAQQQVNSYARTRKSSLTARGNNQQTIVHHKAGRRDFLTQFGREILLQ